MAENSWSGQQATEELALLASLNLAIHSCTDTTNTSGRVKVVSQSEESFQNVNQSEEVLQTRKCNARRVGWNPEQM